MTINFKTENMLGLQLNGVLLTAGVRVRAENFNSVEFDNKDWAFRSTKKGYKMTPVEFVYLLMLIISLGLGHLVKISRIPSQKQLICSASGVLMVLILCGQQSVHSFFTTVGTAAIVKIFGPRYCHQLVFAFCFGYLAIFRAGYYFGLETPTPFSNVIQLLLTLRLVGVAFEVHDSNSAKIRCSKDESHMTEKDLNRNQLLIIEDPSFADICHFGMCYVGLLTGPYYKYKTYHDMLHCKDSHSIPTMEPMLLRMKLLVPFGILFLLLSQYLSVDYVTSDEFYTNGYWYRTLYMIPMFLWFRMRMYSAWLLSECVCMTATLGAYPVASKPRRGQGPTVYLSHPDKNDSESILEYNYETVHNISAYGCDFTTTFRDAMRWWNMSVQWWLKTFVYVRCPIRGYGTTVTMAVSAFWHGIHPGYYLSFLTVPLMLLAEDLMKSAFRTEKNRAFYDWANWFFRMRAFEYLSMGFLLLGWSATVRYWQSTFFIGHLLTFLFIGLGYAYRPRRSAYVAGERVANAKVD